MMRPAIWYLIASPTGDVPVEHNKLDLPLEADPLKTPYRVYFQSIREFLMSKNCLPLLQSLKAIHREDLKINNMDGIIIRAEKHGALYHPASIEAVFNNYYIKFGLNVAVTDSGKDLLKKEFAILTFLHEKSNLPYIPKAYYLDETDSAVFLIEEWFESYHEFHITKSENGEQRLKLWEYGKGDRILTVEQSFEIYRKIAMILTLYYDAENYRMIFPWHHAAGDFIAKTTARDVIDVRLTTVRGYEPFMVFDKDEMPRPALALFYFLLHLSIQMRLDKLDGISDVVWADDFCVDATITGFFEGLEKKKELKNCCGSAPSFLRLLKSFTKNELRQTFIPIAGQFEMTKDCRVIQEQLKKHIDRLYLTLQNFP